MATILSFLTPWCHQRCHSSSQLIVGVFFACCDINILMESRCVDHRFPFVALYGIVTILRTLMSYLGLLW